MARPYATDLRIRAVNACNSLTQQEVAEIFNIGIATLRRWVRRERVSGSVEPSQMGGARGVLISDADLPVVAGLVADHPDILLHELVDAYEAKVGVKVGRATMGRAVQRAGITRKKNALKRQKRTAAAFTTPE